MAYVGVLSSDVKIEHSGVSANVPADDLARVMYYLRCANACLDSVIPNQYTDCERYRGMSADDRQRIVGLALRVSPELLVGRVMYVVPDGHALLRGFTNTFYKITDTTALNVLGVSDTSALLIDGRSTQVQSIMVAR